VLIAFCFADFADNWNVNEVYWLTCNVLSCCCSIWLLCSLERYGIYMICWFLSSMKALMPY